MKKIILFISSFMLLVGCSPKIESTFIKSNENDHEIGSMAKVDDIVGWDISIENIKSVEIIGRLKDEKDAAHPISLDDGIRLVKAYNAIQNKDIYNDLTSQRGEYGISFHFNIITNDNKKHMLELYQFNCITFNNQIIHTDFQLEYYDVIRDIYAKYGYIYTDYEQMILDLEEYPHMDSILVRKKHFLALTERNINETLINYDFNEIDGYNCTFNDLLKPYMNEIELNDVVETNEMYIKVIEMKEGKVTAVAVTLK